MVRLAPVAVLCLLPAWAAAQACPTAADLGEGVRIGYADGASETFYDYPEVEGARNVVRLRPDGGRDADMALGQGLYLLSLVPYAKDGRTVQGGWLYQFGTTADLLPRPRAGKQTTLHAMVHGPDGGEEDQTYLFGEPARVEIGGCGYEALPVELRWEDGSAQELMWLPELTVSYVVADVASGARTPRAEPVSVGVAP